MDRIVRLLLTQPPKIEEFFSSIDGMVELFFNVVIIASVLMTIVGGVMMMLSSGDPQKVKQAQGTITWSIFGLIFGLLARVIIGVIWSWLIGA